MFNLIHPSPSKPEGTISQSPHLQPCLHTPNEFFAPFVYVLNNLIVGRWYWGFNPASNPLGISHGY